MPTCTGALHAFRKRRHRLPELATNKYLAMFEHVRYRTWDSMIASRISHPIALSQA